MTVHESHLSDEGATPDEDADIRRLGELAALAGVVKFPVRIKCATLAWNTLIQALDELPAQA
jgi:nitrogen fixation NifU-like protein